MFPLSQSMHMAIRSIAIFCGSHTGKNPLYSQHATEVGRLLAAKQLKIIYGGGSIGLMGLVADEAMKGGGWVTGIIPKLLVEWEVEHRAISELIVCDDMHQRKLKIYSKADAALILPGGFGTLDELFEIVTWNQLTIHDKEIFILNSDGFYNSLLAHIEQLKKEGFIDERNLEKFHFINTPIEILTYLS
ncbi:MAG: TIGR00730 family Rossman fold protein [Chitinophagaceae bacterium]